jgi:hypothetical protein
MGTPPSQPPTIHHIGAFITGFLSGIVVAPLSFFIGAGLGGLFYFIINLSVGGVFFLISTGLAAFIGAVGAARSMGASLRKAPLAFAIGIGIVPLCASPLWLNPSSPGPDFIILPPLLALGGALAIGGYYGCTRSQEPETEAQHGVGDTCAACSYDLTATADGNPCPECGGMMRYPTKTPAEG